MLLRCGLPRLPPTLLARFPLTISVCCCLPRFVVVSRSWVANAVATEDDLWRRLAIREHQIAALDEKAGAL